MKIASKVGGRFRNPKKCEEVGCTGKWSSAWFPSSAGPVREFTHECECRVAPRLDRKGYQYFGTSSPLTTDRIAVTDDPHIGIYLTVSRTATFPLPIIHDLLQGVLGIIYKESETRHLESV